MELEKKVEKELSQEKLDWLKSIGAVDISKYEFMILKNKRLIPKDYLINTSMEEIKEEYNSILEKEKKKFDKWLAEWRHKQDVINFKIMLASLILSIIALIFSIVTLKM